MEYQLLEICFYISFVHAFENPSILTKLHRYGQVTLSYALALSNFITIFSLFRGLLISLIISCARRMFSEISRPLMKPDWLVDTISESRGANLALKIFEIILRGMLHKLIGLRSVRLCGKSNFGINTKLVCVKRLWHVCSFEESHNRCI